MTNWKRGFWRISILLSVLGAVLGVHWSYRQWGQVTRHARFVAQFEQQVRDLPFEEDLKPPAPSDFWRALPGEEHVNPPPTIGHAPTKVFDAPGIGRLECFRDWDAWTILLAKPHSVQVKGAGAPQRSVYIADIGRLEFSAGMTTPQIRRAILLLAEEVYGYRKPAWYWYASLIVVPICTALLPVSAYGVFRWIAAGFAHASR